MKIYYDKDADLGVLKNKTIAVIGYGSQGHAQAQNLKDSGLNVIVSELEGTANYEKAVADGFKPVEAAQAVADADIIQMLVPDQTQAAVYKHSVAPNLTKGKALMFSHGFNIHYGQIVPPPEINVTMIAPKGPGRILRRLYTGKTGIAYTVVYRLLDNGASSEYQCCCSN